MITNNVYNKENIFLKVKDKESLIEKQRRLSGNLRTGKLLENTIIWEDGEEETYVYYRVPKKY
ncbi:hypothetical protein IHV10_07305 [Fictibacillus sp. 5RED26]|uniref:hypothetical protein n=1 Tax=Fictibacillus sp. 5RED26 TaxID=2745876 RepID=UPI0018CD6F0C|nr:hypothetical protein [Fictibacillus sp. 5RED26]MBH0156167.1 hypothetical protein [Fictibacillus sp. 5RED26]